MYERNAIVLERYFDRLFGYDEKNNIKNNYANYVELVNQIEKYQEATQNEDKIIIEYDQGISKIKELQKQQELLFRKNIKLQEERRSVFENTDENIDSLKSKLMRIEQETKQNNEQMESNGKNYIEELNQFNEISANRNQSSRKRRIIESDYQKKLKETVSNINGINAERVNEIKNFFKSENNIQQEVQEKIIKNGSREKIPFNMEAIEKAIDLGTDIEEKETEILCNVYDKTNRLLIEIKNDTIKIERHKKIIKDAESRINFLAAVKEYLVLFLDNERLNIVGGQREHTKLMNEACDHLEQDLVQIKNLYNLLTKEIAGRGTKKLYKDLYKSEYLYDLEEQEKEFEKDISKLNVIGTVIYPDYWRIEGMQKIFESFKDKVTNVYERDLSEFEPIIKYNNQIDEIDEIEKNSIYDDIDFDSIELTDKDEDIIQDDWEDEEEFEEDYINNKEINNERKENKKDEEENEQDEKEIDEILGLYSYNKDSSQDNLDEEKDNNDILNDEKDEEFDEEEFNEEDEEIDDGYDNINFDDEEDDEEEEEEVDNMEIQETEEEDQNNSEEEQLEDEDPIEEIFNYRGRKRKKEKERKKKEKERRK